MGQNRCRAYHSSWGCLARRIIGIVWQDFGEHFCTFILDARVTTDGRPIAIYSIIKRWSEDVVDRICSSEESFLDIASRTFDGRKNCGACFAAASGTHRQTDCD